MDFFNLKFHNTTVKNEIFAGITLFIAMSYILVVCPTVLSGTGMDYNGIFIATILVTAFTTIVSAFYTKLPIALAPGIGIVFTFAGMATGEHAIPWQVLLAATYLSGIIICAFVEFGLYDKIMNIMDAGFRKILMCGIGMALLLYGVSSTGLLVSEGEGYVFGKPDVTALAVCGVSLGVIFILHRLKKKSALLIGLLVSYVLSVGIDYFSVYNESGISFEAFIASRFQYSYQLTDIKNVMFCFMDMSVIFADKETVLSFVKAVFIFTMAHFFDSLGTNTSTFDAISQSIDSRMKGTLSLKRAISVDGVGGIVSGLLGTSSVTSYCESMVGVVSGGKTGITALTTGILFLSCMVLAPVVTHMSTYVVAPVLIYVGLMIVLRYREFDRSNKALFILGLGLIVYTGITFNIGNAVIFGLLLYLAVKMITEKKKPVSGWWIMMFFAAIYVVLEWL